MEKLADVDHALVQEVAQRLALSDNSVEKKLARIFQFVRDDILFGFPPEGDFVKASQTIARGYGQCNTKGTLFLTLCKAVGIPARLHFSSISKEIQHGFFRGVFYKLMPKEITHSWIEVEIDGKWHSIDSYINDKVLYNAAIRKLQQSNWNTGFSVSTAGGQPSAELILDNEHFSQMAAVREDQGTWEEPYDFYNSPAYLNRPSFFKQIVYRLYLPFVNRRVRKLRASK